MNGTASCPYAGPRTDCAGGIGGQGLEFGGYLILMLVSVGLGTVVAWMLFAKRE
jgi:hypothetical protein